jgi:hypothetical protein
MKRLGEEIGDVLLTRDVYDIDESLHHAVPNQVFVDGNVLHLQVCVRIMSACNGALVVAE